MLLGCLTTNSCRLFSQNGRKHVTCYLLSSPNRSRLHCPIAEVKPCLRKGHRGSEDGHCIVCRPLIEWHEQEIPVVVMYEFMKTVRDIEIRAWYFVASFPGMKSLIVVDWNSQRRIGGTSC